jgi:hypothetical protein
MNPESEGVVITEHRILSKTLVYELIILVAIFVVGLILFLNRPNTSPEPLAPASLQSYGLDTVPVSDTNIYGSIIFAASANETDPALALPYAYVYNESVGSPVREQMTTASEYVISDTEVAYALMTFEKTEQNLDDTLIQPARFEEEYGVFVPLMSVEERIKSDLAVSDNETYYAYTFSEAEPVSFVDTNIAIHNRSTGQLEIVAQAARPHFVGEDEIMYLTTDGVFRQNLVTGTTSLVTNLYHNLTPADDMDISSDGSTLILTIPAQNLISVQWFEESGLTKEIGTIVAEAVTYHTPEISGDNRMYAVVRKGDIDEIEIRFIESSDVLETIPLEVYISDQVRLTDWN